MAAKYDVSCSSSGSKRQRSPGGLGNACATGICHSFTADGRCISLLKVLLTNKCEYDCQYCQNRKSNEVERASLTPEELCDIVISFYKRNYIEGLFLSSAVEQTPNKTMERLVSAVSLLRNKYNFCGYIHLKAIPYCDVGLLNQAGMLADRLSLNIELPSEDSLKLLAPQKTKDSIIQPMKHLAKSYVEQLDRFRNLEKRKFMPAGQTTQMIIGATPDTDAKILTLSEKLYDYYRLKRVYYSAYVPVGNPKSLPALPPNLVRENRLYQADWLLRFYGFNVNELLPQDGNLNLNYDPKTAWAINNMHQFPVEINTCPYEMLLRIPGVGVRGAYKIMNARKYTKLTVDDLKKMRIVLKRAAQFILVDGRYFGNKLLPSSSLSDLPQGVQISMFENETVSDLNLPSVISGEL